MALSQFILTFLLTPFVLAVLGEEQNLPSFSDMGEFYSEGFSCLFSFASSKHPECNFSLFVFVGYNASVIIYQLALSSVCCKWLIVSCY